MFNTHRSRKIDYPRTYFLLKTDEEFYLLFWLEHSKDDSFYVWFDDDPNNSWEVVARHNQKMFRGKTKVTLKHKSFEMFDPHIAWHPSGRIHVTGYDKRGKRKERVISDKPSDILYRMISGTTIPVSQIVFPTVNTKNSLKYLGKDVPELKNANNWVGTFNKGNFHVLNNNAPGEGFFVVENASVPGGHNLCFDINLYWKGNQPDWSGKTLSSNLFPHSFSINRGLSGTTACIRIFSLPFGNRPKTLKHIVATCYNNESVDLFQIKKLA